VRNFSTVLAQIPDGIKEHPRFLRKESQPSTRKRELKLGVLAFDVP
jgi:hypothetical protein